MNNRELVAAAKANLALAEKEVAKWKAVLAAFGEGNSTARPAPKRGRSGTKPNMQAAHDAAAVKRGKATPEQLERHNARLVAQGKPPVVPDGEVQREASLVPA